MDIYNKNKSFIVNNPDLSKGYLRDDIRVKIIKGMPGKEAKTHTETSIGTFGEVLYTLVIDEPEIAEIPEKRIEESIKIYIPYTQEELNQKELEAHKQIIEDKISTLKQKLVDTDYQAIKYTEGRMSEEEYAPIGEQRQAWRDEINQLEKEQNDNRL